MSNTGGFAGSINLFVGLALYYYQCFMYESSLMKRLYREKRPDNDSDNDSTSSDKGDDGDEGAKTGRLS